MTFSFPGGDCKNHENEEEDNKCSSADRTRGNSQKHVFAFKETNQGTNRVAYWAQVHAEGRRKYQHVYLYGIKVWLRDEICVWAE